MTPPLPVRQLADVLEEEAGGNLYAVLSMEDGDCEPLVLDSDLTAEMARMLTFFPTNYSFSRVCANVRRLPRPAGWT